MVMNKVSSTIVKSTVLLFVMFLGVGSVFLSFPGKASALSGSDFNASNIMDDSVFFAPNAMSDSEIQAFLNAKVPICDTNGTQAYGGTTRAAYGASRGYPAPYICLKDYVQTIPGIGADAFCSSVGSGTVSAAQIIGAVARACNINPKVLLVLLQKEQSFITDDWPWSIQYTKATGMGCPDTSLGVDVDANQNGCYDEYEGFFKQVYYGARQFRRYVQQPQSFNYAAGRTSFVAYQANAPQCGGTNITPQNGATAALYNYTPYQPNAAALANLYGTGDACSAYGNRNFWRTFIDWFGSVRTNETWAWSLVSQEIYADSNRTVQFSNLPTVAPGGKFYARVRVMNVGTQTWNNTFLRIGTSKPRDRVSPFFGTGWNSSNRMSATNETTTLPGQIATFDITFNAPLTPGSYRENYNLVADGRSWLNPMSGEKHFTLNVVSPISNQSDQPVLSSGETLLRGNYKLSTDKHSSLILQNDGNLVLYRNFVPVWHTSTSGSNASRLTMQNDGNLVLYSSANQPLWSSNSFSGVQSRLILQNDGNMVIYRQDNNAPTFNANIFSSPINSNYAKTNAPNPSVIFAGQSLDSATRKYRFTLQQDGNLVLYSNSTAVWNSGTFGRPSHHLFIQRDGNIVIYDANSRPIWHTSSFGQNTSQLVVQDDGNVVLYGPRDEVFWQTFTFGR